MELLLNLVWVLLLLPGYAIWRQGRTRGRDRSFGDAARSLLVLGCLMVLLFPVISVTDDLQAARPEMEEGQSKGSVRHASGEDRSRCVESSFYVASSNAAATLGRSNQPAGQVVLMVPGPLPEVSLRAHAGRAPPQFPLA